MPEECYGRKFAGVISEYVEEKIINGTGRASIVIYSQQPGAWEGVALRPADDLEGLKVLAKAVGIRQLEIMLAAAKSYNVSLADAPREELQMRFANLVQIAEVGKNLSAEHSQFVVTMIKEAQTRR